MENNASKNQDFGEDDHEEIPDSFCFCVCLDLLYKPIVLSCGHICCFWCVYKSMNRLRESQCPICRHQYYHFPTVCQSLHFLLLKIYPVAYNRRIKQTDEEEKKSGYYSPQFDPETLESQAKFGHEGDECTMCSDLSFIGELEITETPIEGKKLSQELDLQQKLSVTDVMCTMCKHLLFHPVVLNCGHVYCETRVYKLADEMLRCQVCQSLHPKGFPKVCLEFDHFLEEQFAEEYARRRDAIELNQIKIKPETLSCGNKGEKIEWWSDPDSKVHIGAGCDFCGIYPIIGDRYRCVDCREKMGFDLCRDCYVNGSKVPRRFNQQHTSDHTFKLIQ